MTLTLKPKPNPNPSAGKLIHRSAWRSTPPHKLYWPKP